jgi:hypothetical protein
MTTKRRFQVEVVPDLDWAEFLRRFCHSDELGFDVASTADQFVDWKNPSRRLSASEGGAAMPILR